MSKKILQLFTADICSLNSELQEQLYDEFYKLVYPIAIFVLNEHAKAEVVVQESFLIAIKKPPKNAHGEPIEGWLKKLTRNVVYHYARKNTTSPAELALFDKRLSEVFDDALAYSLQGTQPIPKPSWEQVRRQIEQLHHARLRKSRLQWISLFTVSILLGAFIFSTTPMASAFNPIFTVFKSLRDNVVTFFYESEDLDTNGAKTPPPPGAIKELPAENNPSSNQSGTLKSREVSLDEAKKQAPFRVLSAKKVPARFKLDKTEIQSNQEEVRLVSIRYTENEESAFYIMQEKIDSDTMISSGLRQGAGDIEEIDLGGLKAFLYVLKDGQSKLEWMKDNVLINIMGDVSETEIVDIAKQLK